MESLSSIASHLSPRKVRRELLSGPARWLRRLRPGATILCYHRVAALDRDPQLLAVSPRRFAEQLDVLRRRHHIARLSEWLAEPGPRHRRSIILTFDDGYADNLHEALPLLRAADCPATMFVASGKIGDETEFWWDELERLLLSPASLPKILSLTIGGRNYAWRLNSQSDEVQAGGNWNVLLAQEPSPRQTAYLALCALLPTADAAERSEILAKMRRWAALSRAGRPSHRPLSRSELCDLSSDALIEIGAHSVNHSSLAALPVDAQRFEIGESKAALERLIGKPVTTFSYPFGTRADYSAETIRLVREAGFACARANHPATAFRGGERYAMPCFVVRDWDGDEFAKRLAAWNAA